MLTLSLNYLILTFLFYNLISHITVAVKELSGDEYLLRLSMISALQGLLKVSIKLTMKVKYFYFPVSY